MLKPILVIVTAVALAGCGTVYRSSSVQPGPQNGTNVRVVPMTAETVVQANRSAYQPKTLPAVFSLTAGGGSGVRGAGALPDPSFEPDEGNGKTYAEMSKDAKNAISHRGRSFAKLKSFVLKQQQTQQN